MIKIKCNSCEMDRYRFLFKGKDRLHKTDNRLFNVVKCLSCGLVYLNPQPEAEELKKYYPISYGPHQDNNSVFVYGRLAAWIKKILRKVRNFNSIKQSSRKKIFGEKYINYLDFGCGAGIYLSKLKKLYPSWNLYGLDINELMCKKVRDKGFKVFCGDFKDINIQKNFFDKIMMSQVIEHLHDPKGVLLKLGEIMKKDSELIVSTPNFDSLSSILFRTHWYALDSPRHLFLFTQKTIRNVLKDTGFVIERIEFDRGPKVGIKSLYYLFGKREMGISPFVWKFFLPISYLVSKFQKGSIMTVYARKT